MRKKFIVDMCYLKNCLENINDFKTEKICVKTYIDFYNNVTKSKRLIYDNSKLLLKCLSQRDLSNILGVLNNLLTLANYVRKLDNVSKKDSYFVYENINYVDLNYIINLIDDIIKRPFRFEFSPVIRKHQDCHKYLRLHNDGII